MITAVMVVSRSRDEDQQLGSTVDGRPYRVRDPLPAVLSPTNRAGQLSITWPSPPQWVAHFSAINLDTQLQVVVCLPLTCMRFPNPLSCEHNCACPSLGSAALASTIAKSGRTRKPMITTKCVGAVMLTETRDVLHGAQIPEV